MVLVDSPIWIRFLANQASYSQELKKLLGFEQVIGHELVYGELLIGDLGGRRKFLAFYERIPQARIIPHLEIVEFVHYRKLHGRGIGWIDAHLLASALAGRLRLWTADARLSAIAAELGVAYEVSG